MFVLRSDILYHICKTDRLQ